MDLHWQRAVFGWKPERDSAHALFGHEVEVGRDFVPADEVFGVESNQDFAAIAHSCGTCIRRDVRWDGADWGIVGRHVEWILV